MCTIVILRHVHPEWPLVLAANRDEVYARPATGPRILVDTPRVVGGQDVERGGTWLGVTNAGLFVGLTNQRGGRSLGPAPRSRGEVVLRALQADGLDGVERFLETLSGDEFHPFNLLYGDSEVLRVAYARPGERRLRRDDVPEGVHVLPNGVLDEASLPKVERARQLAEEVARRPWPLLEADLKTLLTDHALPPLDRLPRESADLPWPREFLQQLQALCIHTEGYGTRSSAILALAPGRVGHYLATEKAPCQGATWKDVSGLLTQQRP